MPKDAKLGLVVGVGLIIAVAVVFFRKDHLPINAVNGEPAAASVEAETPPDDQQPVATPAQTTSRQPDTDP